MRRPDFLKRGAAALWCGRRDGTGPPPPASRALRVSCGNGLRPPVTPETSGGPQGQQSGQAQGAAPVSSGALPPRTARLPASLTSGTRTERHWNTTATTGHKRTLVRLRQQAEELQG